MTDKYQLPILMAILNSKRPLDDVIYKNLQRHFNLKYNQQSNAIEGNSLTLNETKVLLENGLTAKGKPFKDHLDIINHQQAIYYLMDIVKNNDRLSEKQIKEFNYILLKGTQDESNGGVYRKIPVTILGAEHVPPQPYLIQSQMDNLILNYNKAIQSAPVEQHIPLIAKLHADFVHIHPFLDGNGRTGRLIMNFELLKQGYPLAILPADERVEYYDSLAQADKGNYQPIQDFIAESVKRTLCEILTIIYPEWQSDYFKFEH